jgi:hypothetical protein
MFPPILHALPGASVRFITPCDHIFQMVIFRFYNLISRISMEWGITWSTHLFTCHCLHIYRLLLVRGPAAARAARTSSGCRRRRHQVVRRRAADLQPAGGRPGFSRCGCGVRPRAPARSGRCCPTGRGTRSRGGPRAGRWAPGGPPRGLVIADEQSEHKETSPTGFGSREGEGDWGLPQSGTWASTRYGALR